MFAAIIPSLCSSVDFVNLFGEHSSEIWSGLIIGLVSAIIITVLTVVFVHRKKVTEREERKEREAEEKRRAEEEEKAKEAAAAVEQPAPVEEVPYVPGASIKVNGITLVERFAELQGLDLGKGRFHKGLIADYLVARFVHRVETNKRGNLTAFSQLPLADTHYVLAKNDNGTEVPQRRCFIHAYEVDGLVELLINNTPEYANSLLENHPYVRESSFPKVNNETWYSVILDKSFTKKDVFRILDDTFFYIYGGDLIEPVIPVAEAESVAESVVATDFNIQDEVPGEKELRNLMRYQNGEGYTEEDMAMTIKQSLALASSVASKVDITKATIADHLEATFAGEVEINRRENYISSGILPLADTHYCLQKFVAGEKKSQHKCFIFVYETEGSVLLLLNSPKEYMTELKKVHKLINESLFPKSKDPWYSVVIDESYTSDEVFDIIDIVKALNELDTEEERLQYLASKGLIEWAKKEEEAMTIKQSLELASSVAVEENFDITKQAIADHLEEKFSVSVEVNRRKNTITSGILPLADTHYCLDKYVDGEKKAQHKCFIFVYETAGSVLLLLNAPKEYMLDLKKNHKLINESLFPKSKERWYSLVVDSSYTGPEVFRIIDTVKGMNELIEESEKIEYWKSGKVDDILAEQKKAMTIKESLALATSIEVEEEINIDKKVIADHLAEEFNDVEINRRNNTISSGILPLADTHYCLSKNVGGQKVAQRKCFIFVYETAGSVLILLNAPKEYMQVLQKKHKLINESLFPKSKDPWYSIVIDSSFSGKEVLQMIDTVKLLNEYTDKAAQIAFLKEKGIL